jgi:hypothetical protein
MRRAIVVAAIGLAAVGVGVFFLTRDSVDVDGIGGFVTYSWGDLAERPGAKQFQGDGTVVAIFSARNVRDHAVKLAVPKSERDALAKDGIRASVVFVESKPGKSFGDVQNDEDLARASTTMPAKVNGALVHVFRVTKCADRRRDLTVGFPLETDGHEALTEWAPSSEKTALRSYDADVTDGFGRVTLKACS